MLLYIVRKLRNEVMSSLADANCSGNNVTWSSQPIFYVVLSFSLLSLIGCLMILVTYCLFKELRSLPGKILMNLASAILIASLLTIISLFVDIPDDPCISSLVGTTDPWPCVAISVFLHYAYLSEFFWMSAMSFEIARTLRQASAMSYESNKKLIIYLAAYFLIGWGTPLIIIAITVAVNFTTADYVNYGEPYCFITDFKGYAFGLFAPVGVSILFNIAAGIFSGYVLTKASVNRYKLHQSLNASYVRVLIPVVSITGVVYILCAIFFAIRQQYEWALYPFVALGTLQGFIVCIAFIFKKKIANLYKAWFVSLCGKCNSAQEQKILSSRASRTSVFTRNSSMLTRNSSILIKEKKAECSVEKRQNIWMPQHSPLLLGKHDDPGSVSKLQKTSESSDSQYV